MTVSSVEGTALVRELQEQLPIASGKSYDAKSEFTPESLLREARRQKTLPSATVPRVYVLDPDGDMLVEGWHSQRNVAQLSHRSLLF